MDKIKEIFGIIAFILSMLVGLIFGILFLFVSTSKNIIVGIIVSACLIIIILGIVVTYVFISLSDPIKQAKINKKITQLIQKNNKTTYDYFLLDVLNEKAWPLISERLKANKQKKSPRFYFEYIRNDEIIIGYPYRSFNIEFKINESTIKIIFDSPELYDYAEENKEFETEKLYDYSFNEATIEDVYDFIALKAIECTKVVNEFIQTCKLDNRINGLTISKIKDNVKYKKMATFVAFLFGSVVSFLSGGFTYQCITRNATFFSGNLALGWTFSIIGLFIGILALLFAIRTLYAIILFNIDKKCLQSCNVNGKCIKVKLSIDGTPHSSDILLKTVTLYIQTNTKIEKAIAIIEKKFKLTSFNSRKIKNLLLNDEYDLYCLKYSKYILTGDSKILKKIIR